MILNNDEDYDKNNDNSYNDYDNCSNNGWRRWWRWILSSSISLWLPLSSLSLYHYRYHHHRHHHHHHYHHHQYYHYITMFYNYCYCNYYHHHHHHHYDLHYLKCYHYYYYYQLDYHYHCDIIIMTTVMSVIIRKRKIERHVNRMIHSQFHLVCSSCLISNFPPKRSGKCHMLSPLVIVLSVWYGSYNWYLCNIHYATNVCNQRYNMPMSM